MVHASEPRSYGNYDVEGVLGEGGMGTVYAGRERLSERPVALKVLRSGLARTESGRKAFTREMGILAGLTHLNIVRSLAALEVDGHLVMVLERLEGETLRTRLTRGPLTWADALAVASQVASALDAAHRHDPPVVHRDIKPENIMLTRSGTVKVMDFGIAKLAGAGGATTTQVSGTLRYMSPEQIDAKPVDGRSDLYGLGLLWYEMLTGAPPFTADAPRVLLNAQCTEPPPPLSAELVATLPPEFPTLLDELLHKDPADRPADARTVLARIQHLHAGAPMPTLSTPDVARSSTIATDGPRAGEPTLAAAAGARPVEHAPTLAASGAAAAPTLAQATTAAKGAPAPSRSALRSLAPLIGIAALAAVAAWGFGLVPGLGAEEPTPEAALASAATPTAAPAAEATPAIVPAARANPGLANPPEGGTSTGRADASVSAGDADPENAPAEAIVQDGKDDEEKNKRKRDEEPKGSTVDGKKDTSRKRNTPDSTKDETNTKKKRVPQLVVLEGDDGAPPPEQRDPPKPTDGTRDLGVISRRKAESLFGPLIEGCLDQHKAFYFVGEVGIRERPGPNELSPKVEVFGSAIEVDLERSPNFSATPVGKCIESKLGKLRMRAMGSSKSGRLGFRVRDPEGNAKLAPEIVLSKEYAQRVLAAPVRACLSKHKANEVKVILGREGRDNQFNPIRVRDHRTNEIDGEQVDPISATPLGKCIDGAVSKFKMKTLVIRGQGNLAATKFTFRR